MLLWEGTPHPRKALGVESGQSSDFNILPFDADVKTLKQEAKPEQPAGAHKDRKRKGLRPSVKEFAEQLIAAGVKKGHAKLAGARARIWGMYTGKAPETWFDRYIGGSMRVTRVLSDAEVKGINKKAGVADLSREGVSLWSNVSALNQSGILSKAQKAGLRLAKDMATWKREVQRFAAGKLKHGKWMIAGKTPDVLQKVGVGDYPMVMRSHTAAKVMKGKPGKHSIPQAILEDLPRLIAEPVAVFDSETEPGSYLVLTEAWYGKGPVVAAVHPERQRQEIVVNILASFYSKDSNPAKFFDRQVKEGRLRYTDAKKARQMQGCDRLQLPKRMHSPSLSRDRILTPDDIVKPEMPLGQGANGSVTFDKDGKAFITLFNGGGTSSHWEETRTGGQYPCFFLKQKF